MQILREHFCRYPLMQPQDVLKLLYQRAFGGDHICPDEASVRAYLVREYEALPQSGSPVGTEEIGGGIVRLYLDGIPRASLDTVARLFVIGARTHRAERERLPRDLSAVTDSAKQGETPFSLGEWTEALAAWREAGEPTLRHSETYRRAYAPAYRVIPRRFVPYLPLLFRIDARLAEGVKTLLAIDGMCGSGKSTLSALLSELYGAAVIHMDDFFLPPALRTKSRLASAGGNIHYERFSEEVTPHLTAGEPFSYRVFDCAQMALGGNADVPAHSLTVVEGSYALHPALGVRYDLTAYVSCTKEQQAARLYARCGNEALYARFLHEWIPMEEAYAQAFSVRERADLLVDTTDADTNEVQK